MCVPLWNCALYSWRLYRQFELSLSIFVGERESGRIQELESKQTRTVTVVVQYEHSTVRLQCSAAFDQESRHGQDWYWLELPTTGSGQARHENINRCEEEFPDVIAHYFVCMMQSKGPDMAGGKKEGTSIMYLVCTRNEFCVSNATTMDGIRKVTSWLLVFRVKPSFRPAPCSSNLHRCCFQDCYVRNRMYLLYE